MDRPFLVSTRVPRRIFAAGLLAAAAIAQSPSDHGLQRTEVRIVGRIVTWDGQPVRGAAVQVGPPQATTTGELLRAPAATSDEQGRFVLTSSAPMPDETEPRLLLVAAKGFASVAQPIRWRRADGNASEQPADVDEFAVAIAPTPARDGEPPVRYAAETAVDDVVLIAGQRLFGRVRDAAGKPLPGALVIARDLLELRHWLRAERSHGFHCSTRTDASGIFDLPCALPVAACVDVIADGFYREQLQPVAAGTPVEVAMQPSGWIQGRVLDPDGRSIAGARVAVAYEVRSEQPAARTGADGSFRMPLQHPGRWRLTADRRTGDTVVHGHTEPSTGPRENLEVTAGVDADAVQRRLPIRVVGKRTGEPVAAFKAVSIWEDYANQSTNYLEYRCRMQLRSAPVSKAGQGQVDGPGPHGSAVGIVRVVAAGFAVATRRDVEWKDLAAGEAREPLVVELEDEATITGTVRDETTGEPVAGARVHARPRNDPNQGIFDEGLELGDDAVATGPDGAFRLGGLGEGSWEVLVRDRKRPRAPATAVAIAAGEQKTGVTIVVPSGATVAGSLVGTPIGHGWRVFLSKLPRQVFGESNQYYYHYNGSQPDDHAGVPLGGDGTFRIDGVALDNHLLVLRLPSPPRLGSDLYLPIEPMRVRRAGVQREFDCREDRPGTIAGKITFAQAAVPFEQLLVVARPVQEDGQSFLNPFDMSFPGPRSFVGPGGEFEVRVGPGAYHLVVVDVALGMGLHQTEQKTEVRAGAAAACNVALELVRIELELKAAAQVETMALVERVELRMLTKAMKAAGMQLGDNDQYDTGGGLTWPRGQQKAVVCLPPGELLALARNNIAALRRDEERWNNAPLGRAEFEVSVGSGARTACTVEVGAPPEIPAERKDDEGQAKGQEAAKDAGR